jgi:hypothetical protein
MGMVNPRFARAVAGLARSERLRARISANDSSLNWASPGAAKRGDATVCRNRANLRSCVENAELMSVAPRPKASPLDVKTSLRNDDAYCLGARGEEGNQ